MADHHKTVVPQNAKITKAQKQANKDAAKMQQKMEEDTLEEHVSRAHPCSSLPTVARTVVPQ